MKYNNKDMNKNKFIDLDGLKLIWDEFNKSLAKVNTEITELTNKVTALKEQIANMESDPSQPSVPKGYVLAKDSDFKWEESYPWNGGAWHYVGNDDKVIIPHMIGGKDVTSCFGMFMKTSVSGVYSDNPHIENMSDMFSETKATSLDLSNFNTSGVTDMSFMFSQSEATELDLSSFDTSKVENMTGMFNQSKATKGYARTQEDADRFNNVSTNIPSELKFIVKPKAN